MVEPHVANVIVAGSNPVSRLCLVDIYAREWSLSLMFS